jgi:hypothetical protein
MFRAEHFERSINVPSGTLREEVWGGKIRVARKIASMFQPEH